MELGDKLRTLRREKGLSQEELAAMIGVSRQALSKWEAGQSRPELDKLLALSDTFGVTIDSLVRPGETEAQPEPPAAGWWYHGPVFEYKSARTLRGLPLVHINLGPGKRRARGVLAIGNVATGLAAVGFIARGGLSVGILSLGIVSIGTLAVGLLACGALALGIAAVGAIAAGLFALGGLAFGVFAVGGCAVASHVAIGDVAQGACRRRPGRPRGLYPGRSRLLPPPQPDPVAGIRPYPLRLSAALGLGDPSFNRYVSTISRLQVYFGFMLKPLSTTATCPEAPPDNRAERNCSNFY